MEKKVFEKILETISHYDYYNDKPGQCIVDLVDNCKELEYLPDHYLHKVYWPEFMGDQIGVIVQEGYLLYKYNIGEYERSVVTKALTSTVVKHLEKFYTTYEKAFEAIPLLEEELKRRGMYNGKGR